MKENDETKLIYIVHAPDVDGFGQPYSSPEKANFYLNEDVQIEDNEE